MKNTILTMVLAFSAVPVTAQPPAAAPGGTPPRPPVEIDITAPGRGFQDFGSEPAGQAVSRSQLSTPRAHGVESSECSERDARS